MSLKNWLLALAAVFVVVGGSMGVGYFTFPKPASRLPQPSLAIATPFPPTPKLEARTPFRKSNKVKFKENGQWGEWKVGPDMGEIQSTAGVDFWAVGGQVIQTGPDWLELQFKPGCTSDFSRILSATTDQKGEICGQLKVSVGPETKYFYVPAYLQKGDPVNQQYADFGSLERLETGDWAMVAGPNQIFTAATGTATLVRMIQ